MYEIKKKYAPKKAQISVGIEFSFPTNDGPTLTASSYSLTTNEDTIISNVYVNDPDFYELGYGGLMQ